MLTPNGRFKQIHKQEVHATNSVNFDGIIKVAQQMLPPDQMPNVSQQTFDLNDSNSDPSSQISRDNSFQGLEKEPEQQEKNEAEQESGVKEEIQRIWSEFSSYLKQEWGIQAGAKMTPTSLTVELKLSNKLKVQDTNEIVDADDVINEISKKATSLGATQMQFPPPTSTSGRAIDKSKKGNLNSYVFIFEPNMEPNDPTADVVSIKRNPNSESPNLTAYTMSELFSMRKQALTEKLRRICNGERK